MLCKSDIIGGNSHVHIKKNHCGSFEVIFTFVSEPEAAIFYLVVRPEVEQDSPVSGVCIICAMLSFAHFNTLTPTIVRICVFQPVRLAVSCILQLKFYKKNASVKKRSNFEQKLTKSDGRNQRADQVYISFIDNSHKIFSTSFGS